MKACKHEAIVPTWPYMLATSEEETCWRCVYCEQMHIMIYTSWTSFALLERMRRSRVFKG